MRAAVLAFGFLVTLGGAAAFAGCGNNVESAATAGTGATGGSAGTMGTTGGAGTTGSTGTMTTTGIGGAMSSSVVSASSSSSSGGPDPICEAGCMHAAACGNDICMQYNFNCLQVNAEIDCFAQCISNTPCPISGSDALACFEGCKGGSSSSSGSASTSVASSSSGMMGNSCQQCSIQQCGGPIGSCSTNQTCLKWLECVNPCNQQSPPDPTCFAACDMQYAGASSLYDAVYACSCMNCSSSCGSIPECSAASDGGTGAGGGDGG